MLQKLHGLDKTKTAQMQGQGFCKGKCPQEITQCEKHIYNWTIK